MPSKFNGTLVFVEPHPTGGAATVLITEDKAIEYQKKVAKEVHGQEYPTDVEALNDFIVIHWAWVSGKSMSIKKALLDLSHLMREHDMTFRAQVPSPRFDDDYPTVTLMIGKVLVCGAYLLTAIDIDNIGKKYSDVE